MRTPTLLDTKNSGLHLKAVFDHARFIYSYCT